MNTTATIRNPISYNLEEDRSRHHLRHFSANDRRIRNSTYSPSSSTASSSSSSFSTSTFTYQHLPSSAAAPMSTCSSSHLVLPSPTFNANTSSSSTPNPSMELDKQASNPRRLRFEIVLEAATAVTQKAEESAITYLNRGQVYGIQLNDKRGQDQIITSTLSIAFHSSSHRRIAESYWKFWIGQQKQSEARAIDIDASQCTGITNLSFPSFDKITFDWNGKYGAKIYVRFKCLSTDFSRIKGVKGIPLRTQMETHVDADLATGVPELDEVCFCKVKLFRDKGAERKNKDDAKQISKQLEKVYGKANEQSLPLMYNVSLPYSIFGEVPTSSTLDTFEHAADDSTFTMQLNKVARYHTRVMTAPNPVFHRGTSTSCCKESSPLATVKVEDTPDIPSPPVVPSSVDAITNVLSSSSPLHSTLTPNDCNTSSAFAAKTEENYDFYNYLTQQQQALATLPSIDTNNLSLDTISLSSQQNLLDASFEDLGTTPFDEDLPPLSADTLYTPNTMQATPIDYQDQHHAMTTFEKSFYTHNNLILTPGLIVDTPSSHSAFIYHQPHINNAAQNTPSLTSAAAAAPAIKTSASVNLASIYDVFTPEEIQQPHQSCSITPTHDDYHDGSTTPQEVNALQQRDYFCAMETTSSNISLLQQQLQLHNENASNIILNSNALSSMLLLSSPPAPLPPSQQELQTNGGVMKKKSTSSIKKQQETADYTSDSSNASGGSHQSSSKKRRYYASCPI
ncbi:Transmembrane 9 superfamily member [Mucor velutinosus]|uniref:Transmembrane 9 superfamily member n=1 Tax=Mucor velutinosus TaxID=708070 RepID=A0AAN7D7Y3_9FUNG|nr:Transmembrane 9 superfamily member [Mucor velutinosus]